VEAYIGGLFWLIPVLALYGCVRAFRCLVRRVAALETRLDDLDDREKADPP